MAYAPRWGGFENDIKQIIEEVRRDNPADWKIAHTGQEGDDRFIRKVAVRLSKDPRFVDVGLNGKRGEAHNISRDVLAFPHPGGCRDASGKFLGLELRDVIGAAGSTDPNNPPRVIFSDVTPATVAADVPGAWVKPELAPGDPEVGGKIPPFPPRDETLAFVTDLDNRYRIAGRRPFTLYVDREGLAVWTSEYLRHRQLGLSHDEATETALEQAHREGLERHAPDDDN